MESLRFAKPPTAGSGIPSGSIWHPRGSAKSTLETRGSILFIQRIPQKPFGSLWSILFSPGIRQKPIGSVRVLQFPATDPPKRGGFRGLKQPTRSLLSIAIPRRKTVSAGFSPVENTIKTHKPEENRRKTFRNQNRRKFPYFSPVTPVEKPEENR